MEVDSNSGTLERAATRNSSSFQNSFLNSFRRVTSRALLVDYLEFRVEDFTNGKEQQRLEELDLESADRYTKQSSLQNNKSAKQVQTFQTTTDGRPKQSTTKELGKERASSGAQSRLQTLIFEQDWSNAYKRLHLVTLLLNITGLLLSMADYFPYAKSRAPLFSLGNVLMLVLVRNEVFLRVVFWLAVRLLGHWWVPLILKNMTVSLLQSLGGIHSGCGLGGIMWLLYALVLSFQNRQITTDSILGVAFALLFLLVLAALAAFPILRHLHHNIFERVHRFAGWSALGLVWAYVVLTSLWNPVTQSYSISSKQLLHSESLWFTVVTTIMIILPWLSVRKVAVETVVAPGMLNSLLTFEGPVKSGLLKRISPSPLSEWHAFGIMSDGQKSHTLLCGAVGDFTKSLVENPPTQIWVRTFLFAGLPYLVKMYQRALLVATGSGMGVYLSFLLQESKTELHMIWITKKIPETFGDWMWDAVKDIPSEKLTIIDTAVSGRPKSTSDLVVKKAKERRAEMVIVTSNPRGTMEIVNGCKDVGIPAFGPIWDS